MSVTFPPGFVASGVASGIKPTGDLDLALVATVDGRPVSAAAVFTTNKAQAAPVLVTRAHLGATAGRAGAVVLNSGCANAATGAPGQSDAIEMCSLVASHLGCEVDEVLVCSTGLIGYRLAMEPIRAAAGSLVANRSAQNSSDAARAILTTDSVAKEVSITGPGGFRVGAMAKGAAMLAPEMATMLAVITTDALVDPAQLRSMLVDAVAGSFNSLLVDGATSTNDTVIALASGLFGPVQPSVLAPVLAEACASLAAMMAADAEGATKVAIIRVHGAADDAEARRAARAVASSQLVQCSLYGADPYWGRVVSELGSAGVEFDPDLVSVAYGDVVVCDRGVATAHDRGRVAEHMAARHVAVTADLGLGPGRAAVTTTDLSPAYIAENMRTS